MKTKLKINYVGFTNEPSISFEDFEKVLYKKRLQDYFKIWSKKPKTL